MARLLNGLASDPGKYARSGPGNRSRSAGGPSIEESRCRVCTTRYRVGAAEPLEPARLLIVVHRDGWSAFAELPNRNRPGDDPDAADVLTPGDTPDAGR
jgi:hypothetical protein